MSTETLSLIIAALAVVVGPFAAYRLGVRRFTHERELDDRGDARATLAAGALELGRMKAAMKDANTAFGQPIAGRADWPDNYGDLVSDLEHGKEWLEQKLAAIEIRFAEDEPVVTESRGAVEAVATLISIFVIARAEAHAGLDRARSNSELNAANETFDAHKKAFLAAAQKAVGVQLGYE